MSFLLAMTLAAARQSLAAPVVVELFTSQGCSSCPDADKLLSTWGKAEFKKGRVIPLSFNVDYWNYLGWKDIFSTPVYSRRQRDYASALGVGVYTPQMVVAGRKAFVGSDVAKAREESERALGEAPAARLAIAPERSPGVKLTVSAKALREPAGTWHVMLALFENDLATPVESGENAGRTLRSDFVVRRLVDLGPLRRDFSKTVEEPWDSSWKRDHCGAAVFIQDTATLALLGATSVYPLP